MIRITRQFIETLKGRFGIYATDDSVDSIDSRNIILVADIERPYIETKYFAKRFDPPNSTNLVQYLLKDPSVVAQGEGAYEIRDVDLVDVAWIGYRLTNNNATETLNNFVLELSGAYDIEGGSLDKNYTALRMQTGAVGPGVTVQATSMLEGELTPARKIFSTESEKQGDIELLKYVRLVTGMNLGNVALADLEVEIIALADVQFKE